MPMCGYRNSENYSRKCQQRKDAEAAVLKKFPNIIVGSSGWARAVASKLR